jgi:hypothetical protein
MYFLVLLPTGFFLPKLSRFICLVGLANGFRADGKAQQQQMRMNIGGGGGGGNHNFHLFPLSPSSKIFAGRLADENNKYIHKSLEIKLYGPLRN